MTQNIDKCYDKYKEDRVQIDSSPDASLRSLIHDIRQPFNES